MKIFYTIAFLFLLTACSNEPGTPGVTDPVNTAADDGIENAVDPVLAAVQPAGYATQLGTVSFPVSCNEIAAAMVERGVALLHHMSYIEANTVFAQAAEADPGCGMAYWGTGMTYIHPLWPDVPSEEQIMQGQQLIDKARSSGELTARESAYITALESYYRGAPDKAESERLVDFDQAWEQLYRDFPEDLEAAAFYALMHLAPPRFQPKDGEFLNQKESVAIVEMVLQLVPDHPGAHHYIIHANDFPELAQRALSVSYNYGKIAPDVPHALHMPSHIFTRRGMWEESVEMNTRSSDVALVQSNDIDAIVVHYPHALDYLVYAYLQTGDDERAEQIRDSLRNLETSFHPVNLGASGYALSAIPARVVLEQRNWAAAAQLDMRQPSTFPWGRQHAAFESLIHYARAIGGARSGDLAVTRASIAELETMGAWVRENLSDPYWFSQSDVQLMVAQAWLNYAEGDLDKAMDMMRAATDIENATDKAGVTPGEVLPAGEMLGDMLVEQGEYAEALTSYEAVLSTSPNRFHSLYGAGHAAELSGDEELAGDYYRQLVEMAGSGSGRRDRLDQALAYLQAGSEAAGS